MTTTGKHESEDAVVAARVAAMAFVPRRQKKPIRPELLAARAATADAKLARIEELLAEELLRHRRLMRRLKTLRRKARARARYYSRRKA